ncbi:MAG: sugar phosphate isomerase/epimerase [Clostridia bacterium]|nr:sugar phosphate isomerase/epimerase [Clostridia bacterium]
MKLGISTASYFGKLLTEDSFAPIRELGLDVCEVFLTTFSELSPSFCALIKERMQGVRAHSIHTLNTQFEPQLFNLAERTRKDAEVFFRAALQTARDIGATHYTFHGPTRLKKRDDNFNYAVLGARMQELCDIAAEYGVTMCYENVFWAYYSFPGYFSSLKQYVPSLGACLDIKQAMRSKKPYEKYIEDMAGSIKTVHLCDYRADGSVCLPGEGVFDFSELFQRLNDAGFNGVAMLETYAEENQTQEDLLRSLDYLRKASRGLLV